MKTFFKLGFTVIFSFAATLIMADEIRIHGGQTVYDRVVKPYKDDVEAVTGHKLKAVGFSTGRGLVDLLDGKCDIAMVAESMENAVETVKLAGRVLEPKNVSFTVIMMDEIVFVTHPSNPVKSLTHAQIRDMHLGKIKNWNEVGGNDIPVEVYADAATGATRTLIKKIVLKGEEFGDNVSTEHSVKKAASRVSKSEGGLAGVSMGFAEDYPLNILKTAKIERPLGFVTLGSSSAKLEQVISAFKAAVVKGGNK